MYNTITAAGYLVSDPEVRNVNSKKVCKLRMCISNNRANEDEKLFIDVEMWGRQAEIAEEYLKKGRSIIVNGELRRNSWENEGKKYTKDFITAQNFQFLNTGGGENEKGKTESKQKNSSSVDEEIPF
jgi:single-strand DNA-binding protein